VTSKLTRGGWTAIHTSSKKLSLLDTCNLWELNPKCHKIPYTLLHPNEGFIRFSVPAELSKWGIDKSIHHGRWQGHYLAVPASLP